MARWKRPRRPLTRGVPVLALMSEDDEDPYGEFLRRLDDARAAELLAAPFRWMAFIEWWCMRRWVETEPAVTHLEPRLRRAPPDRT